MTRLSLLLVLLLATAGRGDPGASPAPMPTPGPDALGAAGQGNVETFLDMYARAYTPTVEGRVFFVPKAGYCFCEQVVKFDHGSPWDYDVHVPLLFHGPGVIVPGQRHGPARPYDVTTTLAALMGTPPPPGATGKIWDEIFVDPAKRVKVAMTVVMDQVGYRDLMRFKDSLPTFLRLMREGALFDQCRLDYLPSATAVTHASVGTGAPPGVHGIASNRVPVPGATELRIIWKEGPNRLTPAMQLVPTLADWHDRLHGNRPVIISHVSSEYAAASLAGHGKSFPGGDEDLVSWYDSSTGHFATDDRFFTIRDYVAQKTLITPEMRTAYEKHMPDLPIERGVTGMPQYATLEGEAVLEMIEREAVGVDEVPDLVLVNLKTTDLVGHFFGHDHPFYPMALQAIDGFLQKADELLARKAGPGAYVIGITADHGVCPADGVRVDRDAWGREIGLEFDAKGDKDGTGALFEVEACTVFVDAAEQQQDGLTLEALRDRIRQDPRVLGAWTEAEIAARRLELYRKGTLWSR